MNRHNTIDISNLIYKEVCSQLWNHINIFYSNRAHIQILDQCSGQVRDQVDEQVQASVLVNI